MYYLYVYINLTSLDIYSINGILVNYTGGFVHFPSPKLSTASVRGRVKMASEQVCINIYLYSCHCPVYRCI